MPLKISTWVTAVALAGLIGACSSSPPPETAQPPGGSAAPNSGTGFTRIVSGSEDSVGAVPGSADALYRYRFKLVDPANELSTFQDRELSFYFKPTPTALHFQLENRQDKPVWIEWDRCTFSPPVGPSTKVAHATTTWKDRFAVQSPTSLGGLQRYGDYLFPIDYLLDPAGREDQLHRPLFPEDSSAPQYTDSPFGVTLVFRIDGALRTYPFRFRVKSVLPVDR